MHLKFRDVSRVQGFTRETLVALIADIREWRESYNLSNGIAVEHTHSSTTECFFSILWDFVGKSVTLIEVCNQCD